MKAIDLKSAEIFEEILLKFEPVLARDPEFPALFDRIGAGVFGIVKTKQPSLFEMMSKMMGGN